MLYIFLSLSLQLSASAEEVRTANLTRPATRPSIKRRRHRRLSPLRPPRPPPPPSRRRHRATLQWFPAPPRTTESRCTRGRGNSSTTIWKLIGVRQSDVSLEHQHICMTGNISKWVACLLLYSIRSDSSRVFESELTIVQHCTANGIIPS